MVRELVLWDLLFHLVRLAPRRMWERCYVKGRDLLLVISVGGFIVLVDQGQNVILEIHCFADGRSD
jgi:hypothetical protein